ncbi:MAG: TfoX/Sxy family protein [Bacteroidia bacterium]
MAYDEHLADRISQIFTEKKVPFEARKMMGGLCFMVDNKMCCGIHFDKKKETDLLMARIGESASEGAMSREGCHPMDFTGRPMRGYVFVSPEGFDAEADLEHWIQLCIDFNPEAKASKKKKKKKSA